MVGQGNRTFFAHTLDPIPETDPPFFVRLFDEHCAAVASDEAEEFHRRFISLCETHYADAIVHPAAHGYAPNESMQTLLDSPLQLYTIGDGWEKRKTAIRSFTALFMQRAVSVCSATMRLPNCAAASGYDRVGKGDEFFNSSEGFYFRVWNSSSEARRYINVLKAVWQKIFELQIRTIRVPPTSFFMYRCQIFSVSAVAPLLPRAETDQRSPILQHEAAMLRSSLGVDLPLHQAGDGRLYVSSIEGMSKFHVDRQSTGDRARYARPELSPRLSKLTHDQIRNLIVTKIVPEAASALLRAVEVRNCSYQACFKESVVSKTLHRKGLNLRFMYLVVEELDRHGLSGAISDDGDELDNSASVILSPTASSSPEHIRAMALELLQTEMFVRTVKEMIRVELRASLGEDDKEHALRINRIMSTLPSKKSDLWSEQVHTILRRKYDAPSSFRIPLSTTIIKTLTTYLSNKLGCAFDKNGLKFVGFAAAHIGTTFFSPPDELVDTITRSAELTAVYSPHRWLVAILL